MLGQGLLETPHLWRRDAWGGRILKTPEAVWLCHLLPQPKICKTASSKEYQN